MSTAHTHPPPMGGMVGHPSVISTSRPLPSPMSTLGSPMNGLASPYPVITSSLGSPSVSLPSTPNMNFGPLSSPQVRKMCGCFDGHQIAMDVVLIGFFFRGAFSRFSFFIWRKYTFVLQINRRFFVQIMMFGAIPVVIELPPRFETEFMCLNYRQVLNTSSKLHHQRFIFC